MADVIDTRNDPEPGTAEYEVTFSQKGNCLDIHDPRTGETVWSASGCGRGPLADLRLPPLQTRHIYLPVGERNDEVIRQLDKETHILVERRTPLHAVNTFDGASCELIHAEVVLYSTDDERNTDEVKYTIVLDDDFFEANDDD